MALVFLSFLQNQANFVTLSLLFWMADPFQRGSTLKRKILFQGKQMFSYESESHL